MKTRITILFLALFMSVNLGFAQEDNQEECMNNLSIFDSYVKSKKYDDAYGPWKIVREKCPKFNRAIYVHGEKILNHKIENSTGAEQVAHINDLLALYDESRVHFESRYPLGEILEDKANLTYKYRKELGKTDQQIYDMFDDAYTKDVENFDSAIGLYTYFSLAVDIYDAGAKTPEDAQYLFDKYDDVSEIIEGLIAGYTINLNKYAEKEEAGGTLTKKELSRKSSYESNIEVFETKIIGSMDTKLGKRANCEVLVPLYQKDFEENKNNGEWLQRAMNRMYAKECKEDPLFLKLVQQKNTIEPNADTAYYLYILTGEQKYMDQTIALSTDPLKKAKLYKGLANELKGKGSYGKARQYYMEALKLNPSDGSPHLSIAGMYANSANSCGDTNFNKRAVFWLAALEAEKAGRVDGRLKQRAAQYAANYRAKAPSKTEIFNCTCAGEVIQIGCWIGRSVTVPKN
ncbi:tetratricopeptide repeat protein [Winogradskyella helgolandensis]|uniref:tetratricopeptide repeat protein n=1 Tax=Winogradskyella helgolandensis TaxID=2697010 RepID=UPI0015BFF80C|nr:tetratricopeptide repeat protein [Winogradskyella helgolandensis]